MTFSCFYFLFSCLTLSALQTHVKLKNICTQCRAEKRKSSLHLVIIIKGHKGKRVHLLFLFLSATVLGILFCTSQCATTLTFQFSSKAAVYITLQFFLSNGYCSESIALGKTDSKLACLNLSCDAAARSSNLVSVCCNKKEGKKGEKLIDFDVQAV